jgi:RNA polymerase sigma factor (sigma-70 family)
MIQVMQARQDLSLLYMELQPQLERILKANLHPPGWVLEDACQTAWSRLLEHREGVAVGRELGWLSTTATRAALQLLRRDRGGSGPCVVPSPVAGEVASAVVPGPERAVELRERLAEVRRLPERQRRVVVLHGFGYGHAEIAAATGTSRRTVVRQLVRARQALLCAAGEG